MQSGKLQSLALAQIFDTILISDAEGISKPAPQIFHRALERLKVRPARSVLVGDHPDVDVAGSRAAGADGVIEELGEGRRWLDWTNRLQQLTSISAATRVAAVHAGAPLVRETPSRHVVEYRACGGSSGCSSSWSSALAPCGASTAVSTR